MKRSKIYLLTKFSEKDLELLKNDLYDHSVNSALRLKNLNLPKPIIENLVKKAIEDILSTYRLDNEQSLGELIKRRVFTDLKAEYTKTYPSKPDKVKWPDLTSQTFRNDIRKSVKKHKLQELFKVRALSKKKRTELQFLIANKLNKRQDLLLSTILNTTDNFSHTDLSKKLDAGRSTITNDIRVLHQHIQFVFERIKVK